MSFLIQRSALRWTELLRNPFGYPGGNRPAESTKTRFSIICGRWRKWRAFAHVEQRTLELVLQAVVGPTGGVGRFTQDATRIMVALACPRRFALTRRFVLTGTDAGSGGRFGRRAEGCHVVADFDQDCRGAQRVDACVCRFCRMVW